MSDAQLDSFPVSELQHRYKIVRSAVYTRLEALNIKPEKQGGRAYVNGEQLQLTITEQHSALAGLIEAIASRLIPMIASQLKPAYDPQGLFKRIGRGIPKPMAVIHIRACTTTQGFS